MGRKRTRKCRHCRTFFQPDPRNVRHQKYCGESDCRRASKQASQRRWLNQPDNRDYFKGPDQVARVRSWRQAHPGYWRRPVQAPADSDEPLQDVLIAQPFDINNKTGNFTDLALQDLLTMQPIVLLGLIATLTDSLEKDVIADTGRRMLRLGQDVLNTRQSFRNHNDHAQQTPFAPRTGPPPATAI